MTQVSFKQMIKDGTVRRADAMKVRFADLHVEEGFNLRLETEDFSASVRVLADYIKEGGVIPPLEVRPRPAGGVYIVDGHRRRLALGIAIEEGAPIEWIDVRAFTGNDADRVARIITSAEGRPLTPLETSFGYKRLVAFGWSSEEIGRRVGRTRSYVDQLLMLANANSDVQNLVAAGTVSAANAVQVVREYGEEAGAILAGHVSKAKASGKARVTAATIRGTTLPTRVVDRLVASIDALAESIPVDTRSRLLAKEDSATTMVAVPANMLSELLVAYVVAKTPRATKAVVAPVVEAAPVAPAATVAPVATATVTTLPVSAVKPVIHGTLSTAHPATWVAPKRKVAMASAS